MVRSSTCSSISRQKWILLPVLLSMAALLMCSVSAVSNDVTTNAQTWYDQGNFLVSEGKYDSAIEAFNNAIRLDPQFGLAWNGKGLAFYNLHRYDEAFDAYIKSAELDPKYAGGTVTFDNKETAFFRLDPDAKAFVASNNALQVDPNSAYFMTIKGLALINLGRYDEALAGSNTIIETKTNNSASVWDTKGTALIYLGRYQEALDAFNVALSLAPNDAYSWNGKGNALAGLGRYSEALGAYNRAFDGGIDSDVWYNRGLALSAIGSYTDAVASYDNALAIKPNFTAAQEARNIALRKLGLTPQTSATPVQPSVTPIKTQQPTQQQPTQQQTKSTPLLYAPIGAIVLTAGIAIWGRRR
jgi:tetratricopeptide (TPR) repeat protein